MTSRVRAEMKLLSNSSPNNDPGTIVRTPRTNVLHRLCCKAAPVLLGIIMLLSVAALPLTAQLRLGNAQTSTATGASTQMVSPDSPRENLREFLSASGRGDWETASEFLVLSRAQRDRGQVIARRLHAVIEQRLNLEIATVPSLAVGDTTEGNRGVVRLGAIGGVGNREIPVEMVEQPGRNPRWAFSATTVGAVDYWFERLGNAWLRDRLPPVFMQVGPLNVYLWQWLAILVAIPVLLLITWVISAVVRQIVTRITARTKTDWDNLLAEHLRAPFRLWIAALVAEPLLATLALNARVSSFFTATTRVMVLIALFWAMLRAIRLVQDRMENVAWAAGHTQQARTLAPLVGNLLRVTLAIAAVLVILAQFGYPVGTLLAGLGIGGIAVALAAQKTVEHLFGSVSLAADQVFRVGDWVRAGATEGSVERIGLRSTSFRTHDRTVVRIPNGRLADERIETFGERDRILLRTDIDLTYSTTPRQLNQIRKEIMAQLGEHPKISSDSLRVNVVSFTDSAIRMNVMAWFLTADFPEFLGIRHDQMLGFMEIVERNGSSFAFPSRTIYQALDDAVNKAADSAVDNDQDEDASIALLPVSSNANIDSAQSAPVR